MNTRKYKAVLIAAALAAACTLTGVVSGSSGIAGFFIGDTVDGLRKDMNQQLNAMRTMMDTNLQTALRAIPGSEWTEVRYWMFQNCATYPAGEDQTKCDQRKKQAQAYLDNIRQATGSSPDTPYQVSVYAEGQGVDWKSVKMDVYQTYFADIVGAGARTFIVQDLHRTPFRPAQLVEGSFLQRPITTAEVSSKLDVLTKDLFSSLLALDDAIPTVKLGGQDMFHAYAVACSPLKAGQSCESFAEEQTETVFANKLKAAIMTPYQTVTDTRTVGRLTKEWDAFSVAQHLVLLIRAGDVNEIFSKGGSLKVQVHERDHPEKPHPRSRLVPLVRADFKDDLFINDDQRGFGKLLYAIMYMQDTTGSGFTIADELHKQREVLKQLMEAPNEQEKK